MAAERQECNHERNFFNLLSIGFIRDIYQRNFDNIPFDIIQLCKLFYSGGSLMAYLQTFKSKDEQETYQCIIRFGNDCRKFDRGDKSTEDMYTV